MNISTEVQDVIMSVLRVDVLWPVTCQWFHLSVVLTLH